MSYRNSDRDGARRRDDRNHRPFRSQGGRRGGGRGYDRKPEGGYRGVRLEINENTPLAQDFLDLGVPEKLALGLGAMGILEPFPIQAATIGDALAGRDVLGRGRTGSGKTLAFGLPVLSRLMGSKSNPTKPRAMILVPTRELAVQVHDSLAPLGHIVGLQFSIVIGGAQYSRQIDSLARGADVVVATPGRLEDLINRGACDLSEVEIAVLDEADQMADMGFLPIVSDLMKLIPRGGQRLLFSATLDRGVDAIVNAHLNDPAEHATEPGTASVTTMEHHVFLVEPRDKFAVVRTIATREGRCIAFVRTQRAADELCDELNAIGVNADALHGGKSQGARNKALANLKSGRISILVATDVAARGIHVDDIDLVLNVDMPRDEKDYLHRAGRTARAGATGVVISVAGAKQNRQVKQLMDRAGLEPEYHRVRADDDIVASLAGATEVVTHRPQVDSGRGDFRGDFGGGRGFGGGRDRDRDRDGGRGFGGGRDRDGGRGFGGGRDFDRAGREGGRDFDRNDREERPVRDNMQSEDRPVRDDFRRDERGGRNFGDRDNRGNRGNRDGGRDGGRGFGGGRDRDGGRGFDRDNRGSRDGSRDDSRGNDRPSRFDRPERPRRYADEKPRRFEDRAPRSFGDRDNRGGREGGRDGGRSFDRNDSRGGREGGRGFERDNRSGRDGGRSFDRNDSRGGRDGGRNFNDRDNRGSGREGGRRDERSESRPAARAGGPGKSANNRAARRAHLQGNVAAGSAPRRGTRDVTAPAKKGRSGKPRTKNKGR
jgi:superfamily II DNA/RNA helicase